ncbi:MULTISPECIES: ribose 5-phosphate isomerase B [unclassified Gluconobacter]|uniref:ribose 5-phosphate isomerase B n=1 Tax=Gluconobacter TaxID=441 RepID=UPI00188BFEFC|nr:MULTISPECIES: ribose 5-phosphate isomerase B [unclassified Gluconobacter]MBF0851437.1 ribose 5-phosphate isomerase B [Gluconobacter sp. R75690]MBF0880082.1 ribose 5-phosphate isomerase B [Gluconobacter sp. R75828]
MKIALGCDEAATTLKDIIRTTLESWGHDVTDYGTHEGKSVLYPDIAVTVADAIMNGKHERGILLCGTGIGVAISANKVPGIRAAQTHDTYSAERAMKSNNAQIITLGARVIGPELAKTIVHAYLSSEFSGGASAEKVERITYYEGRISV